MNSFFISASGLQLWLEDFKASFILNFIEKDRWTYLLNGLGITLQVTLGALILGLFLGFLVAIIRSTADKSDRPGLFIKLLNFLCKCYLTVIRGTPVLIQLLIMYYVIIASPTADKRLIAMLSFGINSGAYVAEIVRSGIMSIDNGQLEAGRSLGFNYAQTMAFIVMPQAFKNVLPALANEFITLLKETSICGYIGLGELTRGGDQIRSQTFEPFLPLVAVALIYLTMVMVLSAGVSHLERRLRNSER